MVQEHSLEKEMATHSSILAWKKSHVKLVLLPMSKLGYQVSKVMDLGTFV